MYTNAHKEMICVDSLHVGLNRFLLLTIGLWPYQQSKLVRLQVILCIGILTSFVLVQLTVFVTLKCTPDLLINVLSSALFYIIFAIKYISFSINNDIVKYLLEQLQHICNELTDDNEINIIKKYRSYAKRYTLLLLLLIYISCIFVLTAYSLFPHILNILFLTNASGHYSLPFMTEYFIDQEKHFYLILCHANAATGIGTTVILGTGTMFIFYQQHACGMFQIASYRIKQAITFDTLRKNSLEKENLIYKGLICAVDMHRKAMNFSDLIISRFKVMFSLLIIAGVISMTLNMFRIFQMVSFGYNGDITQLLTPILYAMILLVYIMTANYFAQEIIDHNNNLFVTVYKVQWYIAPLHIQKLILFLLQRGTKAFNMNIAGLFVGSLQGAATLISTILSYFTVLHSVH
ncbi:uncharacterized protein LOC105198337 isoform X1 [Solenopsis invicta]|uniref:uncharacterized protein LOC105198337 isoform X1 n=2 Tax=Solenopsis invicta TaxID=13686 RepID=UPI00193DBF88|nr:uncharacterized protein LOC105198337 isoform X1 [Solenopsis invicta]